MDRHLERRLLQLAVAIGCLVPFTAGGQGAVLGHSFLEGELPGAVPEFDNHVRYLSGLLLGIGLAFAACIPTIERRSELLAVLTGIVVVGGLARLGGLDVRQPPGTGHLLGLAMELLVVPLLLAWQRRVARRFRLES